MLVYQRVKPKKAFVEAKLDDDVCCFCWTPEIDDVNGCFCAPDDLWILTWSMGLVNPNFARGFPVTSHDSAFFLPDRHDDFFEISDINKNPKQQPVVVQLCVFSVIGHTSISNMFFPNDSVTVHSPRVSKGDVWIDDRAISGVSYDFARSDCDSNQLNWMKPGQGRIRWFSFPKRWLVRIDFMARHHTSAPAVPAVSTHIGNVDGLTSGPKVSTVRWRVENTNPLRTVGRFVTDVGRQATKLLVLVKDLVALDFYAGWRF